MANPEIAQRLREVLGRLTRQLRSLETDGQPTWTQLAVLSRLDREGETTAAALATAERVRPQSMAVSLDALEAADLIVRRPDPSDRRQLRVSLSARGKKVLSSGRATRQRWLAEAIATRLSKEEQKTLERAVDLLERLAEE